MEINLDNVVVTHNEQAQRFEAKVEGMRALITYHRFPDSIVFPHTEVPTPLEGQGLAAKLTRTALDFARAHHLRVVALCPYVVNFLQKHSEYLDLLSEEDRRKISSS